ncbi:MAG: tRNA pseudouridine(13) synthase TruD [Nanoarchaeota archaeon]
MRYAIKERLEDFIVEEVLPAGLLREKGSYAIFLLEKKGRNTEDVLGEMAKVLHVQRKYLGYCGNKDRNAVTRQYVSVRKDQVASMDKAVLKVNALRNVGITPHGSAEQPLSLGDLEGNRFSIIVRGLKKTFDSESFQKMAERAVEFIPNYFDEQRFSKNNAAIGKLLVHKQFKDATMLICSAEGTYEQQIKAYLQDQRHKNDSVGALQLIPKKTLQLFVHAYQAYLFNETLSRVLERKAGKNSLKSVPYSLGRFVFLKELTEQRMTFLKKGCAGKHVPLIGFDMRWDECDGELQKILQKIMRREGITEREFIIRELPFLTSEGGTRSLFISITDFKIEGPEPDEIHPGKKKVLLSFFLAKGSYATIVIKGVFL